MLQQVILAFLPRIRWISEQNIPLHAANAGYFIVLSVFPALLLLLSLLHLAELPVEALLGILEEYLPEATMKMVEALIDNVYRNATGTVAGLSALTALWSSSRGIYGLLTGLNAIYGVSESRGYFYTRSISVAYTFAFYIVLLLSLGLSVFGGSLLPVRNLRFLLLPALQTLLFALMYTVLPNRKNRFLGSLPGALLASLGWLVFSNGYSLYLRHFPSYANIYGSLYAVAISMLWLYFCLCIFFFGGAANRLIAGTKEGEWERRK